jgi:hypothetical protein
MNLSCTNIEPVKQDVVLVVKKKYNMLPVIITCSVFGLLILIGTIAAVFFMRKKKQEEKLPSKET